MMLMVGTFTTYAAAPLAGADRSDIYLPLLEGKRIGLLSNHTGVVADGRHTLDVMRSLGLDVEVIFSPEHGFRGTADAGEKVNSSTDAATGLPIVSLYGKGALDKARAAIADVDVVVCDLQDVGTRFYTYYITMMQLMKIAADNNKEFVVLDRPNPNGMYVDGPILQRSLYSGVGKLPIPVVHGMTLGELARMIVGEKWLGSNVSDLQLSVVPCKNYSHSMTVELPVAPSPNLKSAQAIALYPSLCYFEGTPVSLGRGTANPFTVYGHPAFAKTPGFTYRFTPRSMPGAKTPPLMNTACYGEDLNGISIDSIHARGVDLSYVIKAYKTYIKSGYKKPFFTPFFDNLMGDASVRRRIEAGESAEQIRRSWQPAVDAFRAKRAKYLLYP